MLVSSLSLMGVGFVGSLPDRAAADDTPVGYDFLDFLGDLVLIDGEWVDPIAMQDTPRGRAEANPDDPLEPDDASEPETTTEDAP